MIKSLQFSRLPRELPSHLAACALVIGLMAAGLSLAPTHVSAAPASVFSRRYILVFANLNQPADQQKLIDIMKRGAAAGYNGIVLGPTTGQYIDIWNRAPSNGFTAGFAAIRKTASDLKMALIPYAINPNEVGYAAPDLVEAIPCRNTPFLVRGAVATVNPTLPEMLTNPDFESYRENSPTGWGHDKPGVITYIDTAVSHGGRASVRIHDTGQGDPVNGHGRLFQNVNVKPFRAYEFSVWIKSRDVTDPRHAQFYFEGTDGQQPLVYDNRDDGLGAPLKATQDWRKYTVRFNSCTNTRLALFFGIWSKHGHGDLWFDDADMHEIGLVDTVRRSSLPITVISAAGVKYDEGPDYVVGDGELTIPAGSRIQDGTALNVSWYQQAKEIGPPFGNSSHARYFDIERGIASKLDSLFGRPPGFMMTFDEWRIANWDPSAGKITAGKYMANTVKQSTAMLRKINPAYELYVWSDMFDPNENATPTYYLCNGPLTGSWDGLSPDTIVMTWTGGVKALQFFSGLGMRQMIGGYYDSPDSVKDWMDKIDQAEARGSTGFVGFMYTTWDNKYTDLEKVADLIKARGRWGTGPAFSTTP
jgi:hypothetical protein